MSNPSSDDRTKWWDESYEAGETPWDTGRPQPEIAALERAGEIGGRILDAGCGTGVETRYLAERGYEVVGVDFSAPAIDRARGRTDGDNPSFVIGDALELPNLGLGRFDTVVDCGLFHALEADDRTAYTQAISSVLAPGGRAVCLEFGPEAPSDWGPTRISATAFRRAFADGWYLDVVDPVPFETQQGVVPGVLGIAESLPGDADSKHDRPD
jgi:SAM-dependent methyltransferase